MKKIIATALAATIACSFAGCKPKNEEVKNDGNPTLIWYLNTSNQADAPKVMERINEIIEPEIGAKLEIKFIDGGAYNEKMNMTMASGSEYDLCFTGYVNNYNNAVKMGGLQPIKEIIDKETPQLWDLIPEYAWKSITMNDNVYAVPNVQLFAMPTAVFIDKEMTEKYNFDYNSIKSIRDMVPFFESIKANEPDKYAYQPSFGVGPWMLDYEPVMVGMNELVIRKDDENCKVVKRYETPEYIEAVNTLSEWYKKGYIRKDVASADGDDAMAYEKTLAYSASYKPGIEADAKKTRGRDFVAKPLAEGYITSNLCLQTLTGVSATSKNPEKAVKLLYMLHSNKELYNTLCHGIEGTHYKKLDENTYSPNKDSGYYLTCDWALGNQFNSYILEGKEKDVWEQSEKLNNEATQSRLLGFNFNTENVVNEISRCTAILDEYTGLENGSVDVDVTLKAFSRKLDEAGINTIIAELQKQIDEFIGK